MKKTLGLVGLGVGLLLVVALMAGEWQRRQDLEREQVAYLLASCVNQGMLSLFRLQANDWKKKPDFHRQEEISLQAAVADLPGKILPASAGGYSPQVAQSLSLCDAMTENSIRQHTTIFAPVGNLAVAGPVNPARLIEERSRMRQARLLRQLHVSARAAERYLADLKSDLSAKLGASQFDRKTRQRVLAEIQTEVLDFYQPGDFSRSSIERYIARRETLTQLLMENSRGYSRRAGTLYFHDPALRRTVDSLTRALSQSHDDVIGNWRQVVRHQQRRVDPGEGI
ncbi:hypothetical protein [Microbulbifer guangxiensis]|uniref:hypothetical protein n=1 Tax=Microbulbifer guangxiensis TaxID=2904249 RepID=UPI001F482094|nr:hypothetical protein [Microbulbifer guangxiensis]